MERIVCPESMEERLGMLGVRPMVRCGCGKFTASNAVIYICHRVFFRCLAILDFSASIDTLYRTHNDYCMVYCLIHQIVCMRTRARVRAHTTDLIDYGGSLIFGSSFIFHLLRQQFVLPESKSLTRIKIGMHLHSSMENRSGVCAVCCVYVMTRRP